MRLSDYRGYIFDLDGTVYLGERLLPGAKETIHWLREHGRRMVFLTNKPLQSQETYAAKLTKLGIPTDVSEVINSSFVMAQYLKEKSPGCTAYVIGEPPLIDEIRKAGIRVVEDPARIGYQVDYVVAAFDRTFHYGKLNHALQSIKHGARLVATNGDRTCPVEEGEIPDAAGVIGAIEGVTGKKIEIIVGKPNRLVVDAALGKLGTTRDETIMVGDRLETDMTMGQNAGIATGLVLTGVTKRTDLDTSPVKPTYILENIGAIIAGL